MEAGGCCRRGLLVKGPVLEEKKNEAKATAKTTATAAKPLVLRPLSPALAASAPSLLPPWGQRVEPRPG